MRYAYHLSIKGRCVEPSGDAFVWNRDRRHVGPRRQAVPVVAQAPRRAASIEREDEKDDEKIDAVTVIVDQSPHNQALFAAKLCKVRASCNRIASLSTLKRAAMR
jgi:hypothetical protein